MKLTQNYIQENKEKFLNELIELLKIPSISADPNYSKEVHLTADEVAKQLKDDRTDKVEI